MVSRNSTRCGHFQLIDIEQQLPGDAKPFVNAVAFIEVRIVDEPFPTNGGTRLLEVHSHHHFKRIGIANPFGL
jgi:hypothetical protein